MHILASSSRSRLQHTWRSAAPVPQGSAAIHRPAAVFWYRTPRAPMSSARFQSYLVETLPGLGPHDTQASAILGWIVLGKKKHLTLWLYKEGWWCLQGVIQQSCPWSRPVHQLVGTDKYPTSSLFKCQELVSESNKNQTKPLSLHILAASAGSPKKAHKALHFFLVAGLIYITLE